MRWFYTLLFSVFSLVFLSLLNVSDSFAVSDLSYSVDSTFSFVNGPVFSSCNDSSCLSQYSYFIYSNSCPRLRDSSNFFNISYSSSLRLRQFDSLHYFDVFILPSNISSLEFSGIGGSVSASLLVNSGSDCSISFTLSEHFSPIPSGSLTITENGTYDVTQYAEAVVDVPAVPGDYHDDLVGIKQAIFIGAATLLVIYFFYCIYRMIIKSAGSV